MGIGFSFDLPEWVGGLVFGGVGAIGVALGIAMLCQATAVRRRGIRAQATVIGKRIWTKRSARGSRGALQYVKVRWEDAAGCERVAEAVVNRIHDRTSEGDRVPIIYVLHEPDDETQPNFAFVDEPSPLCGAIGCILFALPFLIAGLALILRPSFFRGGE